MGLVKWLGRVSDPLVPRLRKRGSLSQLRHTICRSGAQLQIRKLYLPYVVYVKETYAKHDLQYDCIVCITRVGALIVATIYLQLIQYRYMFRSFTVLQCSHQHCVQPVASDVEVVGYL